MVVGVVLHDVTQRTWSYYITYRDLKNVLPGVQSHHVTSRKYCVVW